MTILLVRLCRHASVLGAGFLCRRERCPDAKAFQWPTRPKVSGGTRLAPMLSQKGKHTLVPSWAHTSQAGAGHRLTERSAITRSVPGVDRPSTDRAVGPVASPHRCWPGCQPVLALVPALLSSWPSSQPIVRTRLPGSAGRLWWHWQSVVALLTATKQVSRWSWGIGQNKESAEKSDRETWVHIVPAFTNNIHLRARARSNSLE